MKWAVKTDVGLVRENQEDSLGYWPEKQPSLFMVADGLGGLPDGEIASSSVIGCMQELAERIDCMRELAQSVQTAHRLLRLKNAGKDEFDSMATTLTACFFQAREFWLAHVGDCRLYRARKGKIKQLTRDHAIDDHVLTQALGLDKEVDVESKRFGWHVGDRYMICSDGLYGLVKDEEILKHIVENEDLTECVGKLVEAARKAGGDDNITVIVIEPHEN